MTKAEQIDNTYQASDAKLRAYIRAKGLRPTKVRNMVLKQICSIPRPFTADQLVKACEQDHISVGTIYNSLRLFIDAGILRGLTRQRGQSATEYDIQTDKDSLMQIICTKCGRVARMEDRAIYNLVTMRRYSNFNISHFSLYVYGECKVCRRLKMQQLQQK